MSSGIFRSSESKDFHIVGTSVRIRDDIHEILPHVPSEVLDRFRNQIFLVKQRHHAGHNKIVPAVISNIEGHKTDWLSARREWFISSVLIYEDVEACA